MTPSPLTIALCLGAALLAGCSTKPTTQRSAPLLIADQPGGPGGQPNPPLPARGIQFDQNDYSAKDKYALDQRRESDVRGTVAPATATASK